MPVADGSGHEPLAANLLDRALEATVIGSFSRIGATLRRRAGRWTDPPSARGRTVVITGATSGLGLAAALDLARHGADLCLVGRNPERLSSAAERVDANGPGSVSTQTADLEDLGQTAQLAEALATRLERIDVLIHNAGALFPQRRMTSDGLDATVALHLLAPYLLTELLLPSLRAAAPSRVITVTSGGMYTQRHDLAKLQSLASGSGPYRGSAAYALAKRAQVVLGREWQRRYGMDGVDFHLVHPGWAATPGLATGLPGFARVMGPLLRSPAEGADTIVCLAAARESTPAGGRLWFDRRPRSSVRLPWTWTSSGQDQTDGVALWRWCQAQVASFVPVAYQ
jgi:NAD(P)-dependent dehydrogenase (short-subunit alcohol dehydrogenase family)